MPVHVETCGGESARETSLFPSTADMPRIIPRTPHLHPDLAHTRRATGKSLGTLQKSELFLTSVRESTGQLKYFHFAFNASVQRFNEKRNETLQNGQGTLKQMGS